MESGQSNRRHRQIEELLNEPELDVNSLRRLTWHGAPTHLRPTVWQLLLEYLPYNLARREATRERKRNEYNQYIHEIYDNKSQHQTEKHRRDLRQIDEDLPRTQPPIPIFRLATVRDLLRRVLYIWSVRNPASGYVQGINDILSILLMVFLQPSVSFDVVSESGELPDNLKEIESDCYWCLTTLMHSIQDFFFPSSPGIQRAVLRIQEIVQRIDTKLYEHLQAQDVEMLQFAFRWFNCALVREFEMSLVFRLWDALLSEQEGFSKFMIYICAALILKWADRLKKSNFQDIILLLQNLPTSTWTERDLEELLSQAYVYYNYFANSPNHLRSM
jgi:hypothetical protein